MFAQKEFVELSRSFVCVRLDTYESEKNQKVVREVLHGKLANTAFVVFAPDGKTQLCRSSRSPGMTFGNKGWRKDGNALEESIAGLAQFVEKHPGVGRPEEALVPDFYSFGQGLNVSSADQRLLVMTVAPSGQREALKNSLKAVANDPKLRGKFHYDMAQNSDAKWAESIENVKSRTGHFIIYPGEFGLKGKVMVRLPLNVNTARMKEMMEKANAFYMGEVKPKNFRAHLEKGQALGMSYVAKMPLGLDKNRDGVLDRVRGSGRKSKRRIANTVSVNGK